MSTDFDKQTEETGDANAPRLGRIPRAARLPLLAFWFCAFASAIVAQAGGLYLALADDVPLGDLLLQGGTGLVAAAASLMAAALLVRRDPADPIALLLSLSCICAAAYVGLISHVFYEATELQIVELLLPSLWLGLLVAALPAFPDGRFVPGWSRWLTILALPFALFISIDVFVGDESLDLLALVVGFAVAIVAVAAAVIRFRRTPPSLERQQLKWAALGVSLCISLLIFAVGLAYAVAAELFPDEWMAWLEIVFVAMQDLSFTMLALGFLMSLLRLRLWDADRVIGRSAAYFMLTLVIGCVWAVSTALVNDFVSGQVGAANKGMVAAISTVIALLVFGPARERVNKWVEQRLQRGIVRLRGLPDRLAVWQHLDDPQAFGGRVAEAVSGALHAPRCAVLLFERGAFRPLANVGQAPDDIARWIANSGSFSDLAYEQPDDRDFPLRLVLIDEDIMIGALLVGPRSDGSFFAKEERAALLKLEPPLAASLNRVHQRVATTRTLAKFDQRLDRIEEAVATKDGGQPPPPPLEDVPKPS